MEMDVYPIYLLEFSGVIFSNNFVAIGDNDVRSVWHRAMPVWVLFLPYHVHITTLLATPQWVMDAEDRREAEKTADTLDK